MQKEERGRHMSLHKIKGFADKHQPGSQPDTAIRSEIENRTKDGELPCAVAFKIVEDLGVSPAEVGKTADLLNCTLAKCQLGLFGYESGKKIAKLQSAPDQDLIDAISAAQVSKRLACKSAWDIAQQFNVSKMTVSGVCEHMGIKIKPCQLGAF
jgi:hypothetical protein